ncbi:hypothetical protein T439DRAFT_320627 [Meredithblackwellia eburnea MCA 4105]
MQAIADDPSLLNDLSSSNRSQEIENPRERTSSNNSTRSISSNNSYSSSDIPLASILRKRASQVPTSPPSRPSVSGAERAALRRAQEKARALELEVEKLKMEQKVSEEKARLKEEKRRLAESRRRSRAMGLPVEGDGGASGLLSSPERSLKRSSTVVDLSRYQYGLGHVVNDPRFSQPATGLQPPAWVVPAPILVPQIVVPNQYDPASYRQQQFQRGSLYANPASAPQFYGAIPQQARYSMTSLQNPNILPPSPSTPLSPPSTPPRAVMTPSRASLAGPPPPRPQRLRPVAYPSSTDVNSPSFSGMPSPSFLSSPPPAHKRRSFGPLPTAVCEPVGVVFPPSPPSAPSTPPPPPPPPSARKKAPRPHSEVGMRRSVSTPRLGEHQLTPPQPRDSGRGGRRSSAFLEVAERETAETKLKGASKRVSFVKFY